MSTIVAKFRDYLTARDLTQAESAGGFVVPRLPAPLPASLRRVAVANLILFGLLVVAGALFVLGSGVAVVVMPFAMGREGVGTAMITLFLFCVVAVASGISLLAARAAARVIRREVGSVGSLYVFALVGAVFCAAGTAVAWWLAAAFFADGNSIAVTQSWPSFGVVALPATAFLFFLASATVLRRYRSLT